MAIEHEVDAFADVHRYRNLRALVEQLQAVVLFRRDVDRRGDLLACHGYAEPREPRNRLGWLAHQHLGATAAKLAVGQRFMAVNVHATIHSVNLAARLAGAKRVPVCSRRLAAAEGAPSVLL